MINYLGELFKKGYEYRTICSHRSAISAFHDKIQGRPIGEHPKVSSLISGVFNEKPPQPKHTFIWDVQVVIDYIKQKFKDNRQISIRSLSLKLTMLLALTSASRVLGIHNLDINFMTKTNDQYTFTFNKLHKSWRQGQPNPSIVFVSYPEDEDLCVFNALTVYLERTSEWRNASGASQLLISTISPHKGVVSSTIAGWIKTMLKQAGIDATKFSAHSTRSASTSKAELSGLSVKDILERGSWSKESTWQRFYRKEICSNAKYKNFQNSVFKRGQNATN